MGRSNRGQSGRSGGSTASRPLISKIMLGVAIVAVVALFVYLLLPPSKTIVDPPITDTTLVVQTVPGIPAEAVAPKSLDIYLDMSGSMKGYSKPLNDNTYRDAITHMQSMYGSDNATVYLGDVKYDGQDLIDDMYKGRLEYKKSSLLNEDIDTIATMVNADPTMLAVFVTDGILSGTDKQIKTNPHWTPMHKEELQNQIKEALLGKKDVHASIYQFITPFDGEYWDMTNNHKLLKADRYFYVVALGRPQHLADFKAKMGDLQANGKLRVKNQWHAIDQLPLSTKISVGGGLTPGQDGKYVVTSGTKLKNTADTFGVTKEIIPMYFDTKETFKNHSIAGALDGIARNAEIRVNGKKVTLKGDGAPAYDASQNRITWHILKEEVPKNQDYVVEISLPIPSPKWIEKSTLEGDDDTDIWSPLADQTSTFLLKYFINGIREGVAANDSETTDKIYTGKVTFTAK